MGQYNNYIFKTPFWEYYGNLPNSGEKLGHEFPSLGKYWTKKLGKFCLGEIESTILGKYWEILRVHSTRPNFFGIWEIFFQKWENIGNRVVKCFWIFPILGRNGT